MESICHLPLNLPGRRLDFGMQGRFLPCPISARFAQSTPNAATGYMDFARCLRMGAAPERHRDCAQMHSLHFFAHAALVCAASRRTAAARSAHARQRLARAANLSGLILFRARRSHPPPRAAISTPRKAAPTCKSGCAAARFAAVTAVRGMFAVTGFGQQAEEVLTDGQQ